MGDFELDLFLDLGVSLILRFSIFLAVTTLTRAAFTMKLDARARGRFQKSRHIEWPQHPSSISYV